MKDNHILPFLWMRGEEEGTLRREIAKIYESGIRSVCLEARPHPDYAGEQWWHDVDIVIDEAKTRNMTIWILDDAHFPTGTANNSMERHPDKARRFLVSQSVDVVGPMPSAQVDVDQLMTKQFSWMDFGKPRTQPLIDETRLLSVTACRVSHDNVEDGQPINMTANVKDGCLTADIPKGVWRIHVNFVSTAFDPMPKYINYIEADSVRVLIDEVYEKHYARYKDYFGTVIAGFFSDEPGFYNTESYGAGKVGMQIPLPWGNELEAELKAAYGDSLYNDLALLFADHDDKSHRGLRVAYMDSVSRLYGKNFTKQLGDWCRAHGVEYIGHVVEERDSYMELGAGTGHYFRAMEGQDMAGIDNIGSQLMPCNDVATRHTGFKDLEPNFFHYYLGKLGASAAAIDRKKRGRLMCENFGAYGWSLGVRGMKWLVDYWISQGVNYFTPHSFSMAEYPDEDCPPHFYAGGNNPQFPYFCALMKYTDRLCRLFSDGQNVPQVAVLFEAEAYWSGETMRGSVIGRELLSHQLDFEIIPSDVFAQAERFGREVEDGALMVNGRRMNALIVPACEFIPSEAARFIAAHPELPVLYVDSFPQGLAEMAADGESLLKAAINGRQTVPLGKLAEVLKSMGISDALTVEGATAALHQYHYRKDGREIFQLMNVSSGETLDLSLSLPSAESYGIYDAMEDCTFALQAENGRCGLKIPPYQSVIIVTNPAESKPAPRAASKAVGALTFERFNLELRKIGKNQPEVIKDFSLKPVSLINQDFAGDMIYTASFSLDKLPGGAVFTAQHVYECMTVTVNGKAFSPVIVPPYSQDVTKALRKGENQITITVASTPLRNANTKPGPFGEERTIIEPTGMFGKVELKLYE